MSTPKPKVRTRAPTGSRTSASFLITCWMRSLLMRNPIPNIAGSTTIAAVYGPIPRRVTHRKPTYMATMSRVPWAKLMIRMIPKISVSPRAMSP
jgi:hypothetical protein